ncbi:hypothetical protein GPALN_014645 [Globodera pallida]|uniref:MARVEL domain-containing protein n=1 Tax=Globodera pallida TaxID=36090 RepID=A0A183CIP8_GLOPA|nr:hypothetical protein GPALN_014645 [Globodera pallida]
MQFNPNRFTSFPELLKFTTLLTSVLVMLSLGSAAIQPPGTTFVWITAVLALIVDCLCILALGFELEGALFKPDSPLGWPLIECVFSSFFAINYFISIWLCVNSKVFAMFISSTAYSLAATFCLVAFVQFALNVIFYARIWSTEQRRQSNEINPSQLGYTNYGSP